MKNKKMAIAGLVLAALSASPAFADRVDWNGIVGVITAPSVDSPVGNVHAGTFPWSVRAGRAHVNLTTGETDFVAHGLVINGQIFSGTPGPVQTVTGTLVCNAGDQNETELDTSDVPLDGQGNARFSGMLQGIPGACTNPLFLVRIGTIANPANPNGARGFWIATGTERTTRP